MRLSTTLAIAMASFTTMVTAQSERDLGSHEHGSASLNVALDDGSVYVELETPWNNLVGFEHSPRTDEQHTLVNDVLALLYQPEQLFSFKGTDCIVAETVLDNGIATEDDHEEGHDDDHKDGHDDDHKDGHDDDHKEGHDDDHKEGHDDDHKEGHDDDHKEGHDDDHKEGQDDDHKEGHDDDHKEDHVDDHKDGHDDDHEEGHDEHGSETDSHSSLLVSYAFTCDDAARLVAIDVNLLERWSGFEDLDVQLIGPGGQALVELNPQNIQIDITPIQ